MEIRAPNSQQQVSSVLSEDALTHSYSPYEHVSAVLHSVISVSFFYLLFYPLNSADNCFPRENELSLTTVAM